MACFGKNIVTVVKSFEKKRKKEGIDGEIKTTFTVYVDL